MAKIITNFRKMNFLGKAFTLSLAFFIFSILISLLSIASNAILLSRRSNRSIIKSECAVTSYSYVPKEYSLDIAYEEDFAVSFFTADSNEDETDIDPLSLADDDFYEEITFSEETKKRESTLNFESTNNNEYISGECTGIEKYAEMLELNVPFTVHAPKSISISAYQILSKVVHMESGNCPFEQQAAIASLILNRLDAEEYPSNIFEIVSAPKQFRENYAYAPFPEISEKTKMAIECALSGIDFSCGAVAYYNPEYSSESGKRYFETSTTMCAQIVEYMNLVLCCLNEHKNEVLSMPKYIYNKELKTATTY